MRNSISAITALLFGLTGFPQNVLTNKEPCVSIDGFRTLFFGLDNLVTISTGGYDNVVLEISNGTVRHLDKGQYVIRPANDTADAILKMKTRGKTYEFIFQVRDIPDPGLRVAGVFYGDGGNLQREFKISKGVGAILRNFYYEIEFNVLSFDIAFSGEGFADTISHTNNGAAWDSVSRELIDRCRPGSKILINHAYVKGSDGRTRKLWDELPIILL